MTARHSLKMQITRAQVRYLTELIRDDIEMTDLTPEEVVSAQALLSKAERLEFD